MAPQLLVARAMRESSATVLAVVTLVAAVYLMELTDAQGVGWRGPKRARAAGGAK